MMFKNSHAVIQVEFEERLCVEAYSNFPSLGQIAFREEGKTIASGIVLEIL